MIVFKVHAQVQLQKVEDGRAVATAATAPRPFCRGCQSFKKCGILGDEYFSRVYHDEFLALYAQRARL